MHLSAGMMVSTNVRLTRPLGEGAMGAVWVADHLTLKTEVAVKFISAALATTDPEILGRFVREASLAAQIKSPHVVQTFDQGVMGDGTPYIVMELLEGESLQEMLDRLDHLEMGRAAQVVVQVARALGKAHELGIVHRDIKPDNIFITHTEDGMFAKVLDFGIAKQTQQLPKMGGLTSPGVMVGTPEYMSPEQVLSAKDVDYRADLWALAVTAYYCLTGCLPFTAEALGALCVKLLEGSFTPVSELHPDLHPGFDAFFTKALAQSPDDRFTSAREMAGELVRLVRSTTADIADDMSFGGVTPPIGLAITAPPHGVAPIAADASGAVPLGATAKSETLTGSSSNRHQPPLNKTPSWVRVGAVASLLVTVVGGTLLWMVAGRDTTDTQPAATTPNPGDATPASSGPPASADPKPPPPAPAAAPVPEPSATASASASAKPRGSASEAPAPAPVAPIPVPPRPSQPPKPNTPDYPSLDE